MNFNFKDVVLLTDMIIEEKREENKKKENEISRINIENQNKSIIDRLKRENSIIRSKLGG